MGTNTLSLRTLIEKIDSGSLVLPEIQRDFVWKRNNVQMLFDSLYRRLPIGYMLVWKAKTAVDYNRFKSRRGKNQKINLNEFYGYLLDGQQRLSSIILVRDGDENYPLVFSLRPEDPEAPDEGRFSFKQRKNNPWYVQVSDVISDNISPSQILNRIREKNELKSVKDEDMVLASINKLKLIMDYQVGVIEFEEDDYRKATELFIRFNSTGKKLNRNDLVAAELALAAPGVISKDITNIATIYSPNFVFTRTFLVQCLVAVHTGKIKFKNSSDVWSKSTEGQIKKSWEKTKKGIARTIDFLTGDMKWDSDSWVPSIISLIPIIYVASRKKLGAKERILARKWLHMAGLMRIFSGLGYAELDRLLRGLSKSPSFSTLMKMTKRYIPKKLEPSHFETSRKSGAVMALYISMLRHAHAKDWVKHTLLDGSVKGYNAKLEIHHFFPRNLLLSKGYDESEINTFANYTIVSKEANLEISDEEPASYVTRLKIPPKFLKSQCIPMDRRLWKADRYRQFLEERRKLLAKTANSFLGVK